MSIHARIAVHTPTVGIVKFAISRAHCIFRRPPYSVVKEVAVLPICTEAIPGEEYTDTSLHIRFLVLFYWQFMFLILNSHLRSVTSESSRLFLSALSSLPSPRRPHRHREVWTKKIEWSSHPLVCGDEVEGIQYCMGCKGIL